LVTLRERPTLKCHVLNKLQTQRKPGPALGHRGPGCGAVAPTFPLPKVAGSKHARSATDPNANRKILLLRGEAADASLGDLGSGNAILHGHEQPTGTAPFRNSMDHPKALDARYTFRIGAILVCSTEVTVGNKALIVLVGHRRRDPPEEAATVWA
jgi:hypothetical protein